MLSQSTIVVFGGTGFIGRHLVARLLAEGHDVTVVTRSPRLPAERLRYVRANLADRASIHNAVSGASAVIHLATGTGESWADFERDFVDGTRAVAEACLASGVKRLIYASSIAALYLGDPGVIDERTGPDPLPQQRSFYSRAKIAAETLLNGLHKDAGLPVVIFRPGAVVGRGGTLNHAAVGWWPSDTCCIGWGMGQSPLPFVLAADVANAMSSAVSASGVDGRTFNLVGDVRPSAAEYVSLVATHSHRNFRFYPRMLAVLQAVDIAKWLLKGAARKAENPYPSSRDLKSRSLVTQFDCTAARTLLNWTPASDSRDFVRDAVLCHVRPPSVGDLRLRGTLTV